MKSTAAAYSDLGARFLSCVLEILFPGRCLSCGAELLFRAKPFYPLCNACLERFSDYRLSGRKRCRLCSRPLISERAVCTSCRGSDSHFSDNTSLMEYRGLVRDMLLQYKVGGRRRLALVFADLLALELKRSFRGLPVVPVPPRPAARRRRGWDHVDLICRRLSRRHGIMVLRCLRRGEGRPQKNLPSEERRRNILGASIRFDRRFLRRETPGEVVLVDDVFTTGATADGCARRLLDGGVERVRVLTLALD